MNLTRKSRVSQIVESVTELDMQKRFDKLQCACAGLICTNNWCGGGFMLREKFFHGFHDNVWNEAKQEVRDILIDMAKRRSVISCSNLVAQVRACSFEPRGSHLAQLLGETSSEKNTAGLGLLTVVVVHKAGDMRPGLGFFELAQSLGRSTVDKEAFWIEELKRVYKAWSS